MVKANGKTAPICIVTLTFTKNGNISTQKRWKSCRKQEEIIRNDLGDGIDYSAGEITVAQLVDRYVNLKRSLKPNSMRAYKSAINRVHTEPWPEEGKFRKTV